MNRGSERFHTLYPFAYRLPRSVFVNLGLDAFAYRLPRDESVFFTYYLSNTSLRSIIEHGIRAAKGKAQQTGMDAGSDTFAPEDFQLLYQPTAGVSVEHIVQDPGHGSEEGHGESTNTARSQVNTKLEP